MPREIRVVISFTVSEGEFGKGDRENLEQLLAQHAEHLKEELFRHMPVKVEVVSREDSW